MKEKVCIQVAGSFLARCPQMVFLNKNSLNLSLDLEIPGKKQLVPSSLKIRFSWSSISLPGNRGRPAFASSEIIQILHNNNLF